MFLLSQNRVWGNETRRVRLPQAPWILFRLPWCHPYRSTVEHRSLKKPDNHRCLLLNNSISFLDFPLSNHLVNHHVCLPLTNRHFASSNPRLARCNDDVLQITSRLQPARTRSSHGRTRRNATRSHRLDRRIARAPRRKEVRWKRGESVSTKMFIHTSRQDTNAAKSEELYTSRGKNEKKWWNKNIRCILKIEFSCI